MKHVLTFVLVLIFSVTVAQKDVQLVKDLMHKQQLAWNSNNLEGFMEYYWKSDSLKFIGSKGLTYGWQKTLDNYKKSYPDADAMGVLAFDIKSAEMLGKAAIYVIGKWTLHRKDKDVGGYFTLLWKKMDDKWVIVADHTS